MIVVTGAAGFIGSNLVKKLNDEGHKDLILVDDFSDIKKNKNLAGKHHVKKIGITEFISWFRENSKDVNFVFHIGAITDTTETSQKRLDEFNLNYTKSVWSICVKNTIPFVYASSAATYGAGEYGYSDSHKIVRTLKPLNMYGVSKNNFDKWALAQTQTPPLWVGLKFFNVFGPNEYHKNRMASVVLGSFKQIEKLGAVTLFKSHNAKYENGGQLRDFVYVKDVVNVCTFFMNEKASSGLYNVGTGQARTFSDLARSVFNALRKDVCIEYVETPLDIREKYQYFTEADITKLRAAGYHGSFHSLEDGIRDYVQEYLVRGVYI